MKKILLSIFGFCLAFSLKAQTAEEFLQPQKKQEEYLILQLGALKIHSALIKRSAEIIGSGLTVWNSIKTVEEDFHQFFFASYEIPGAFSERSGSANTIQDLISELRRSHSYWKETVDEESFWDRSNQIHINSIRKALHTQEQFNLIVSENGLKASDYERSILLGQLAEDLNKQRKDFNRIQQLHNSYLEEVTLRNKWIKDSKLRD
jgi:hypothetical protein